MKLKRVISAIALAAIMLGNFAIVHADDDIDAIYRIIAADSQYQKAAAVCNGFGVLDITEDPEIIEGTVTREEFVVAAAKAMNIDIEAGDANASVYSDVDERANSANAIAVMTDCGYVSGNGNGEFLPYDDLLFEDAICIAVNILGYKNYCMVDGGYPTGYTKWARRLSLLSGVEGTSGEPIKYREAVKLLYNVLNADVCKLIGYVYDGSVLSESHNISDGTTLLRDTRNVYKSEGIVTANYITGLLSSDTELSDGQLEIDNVKYDVSEYSIQYGEINALSSMLGYEVEYYFTVDGNRSELMFVYVLANNNELMIKSDRIMNASVSEIQYYDDNDAKKRISLSKGTYFIYNGKADNAISDTDMTPGMGWIKLVDNNGDRKYDIAFVVSYDDYYVSSINYDDRILYDNESSKGESRMVNFGNENDVDVVAYIDGEEDSFEGIMPNGVISVSRSKTGDLFTVYIGIDEVDGTVTTISDDKYTIDGEEYELASSYKNPIRLNDTGTFYLDVDGRIAGVKRMNGDERRFGLLWQVANTRTSLWEDSCRLEIYTTDSVYEIFECAEKVMVDGVKMKSGEVANHVRDFAKDIIAYEVNDNNEVTLIDTPVVATDNSVEPGDDKNNNLMERFTTNYRTYKGGYKSFVKYTGDDSMFLSSRAVIFGTGTNVKENMVKERIITMTPSNFWSDADFQVRGFSTDSVLVDVVVYTEQRVARTSNSPLLLVTDVFTTLNEEGELQYQLEGLRDGREDFSIKVEIDSEAEELAKSVCIGDGVVLLANLNGEVYSMIKLFDYEQRKVAGNLDTALNTSRGIYGDISKFEHNIVWIKSAAQTQYYALMGTKIYIFDTERNKAYIGKSDDVQQGQKVLARVTDETIKELIIFK